MGWAERANPVAHAAKTGAIGPKRSRRGKTRIWTMEQVWEELYPSSVRKRPRKRLAFPKHGISGVSKGKWQTLAALAAYRTKRDQKNRAQKVARRINRQRAA